MGALSKEAAGLRNATEAARMYEENVRKALNIKERWRIPIVFIKVSKSRRLSATDTRIWQKDTSNMKTEDAAAHMAAVLSPQAPSTEDSSLDFTSDLAVKPAAVSVAYVAAALGANVSKAVSGPRPVPALQKTPSRLTKQRSAARLKIVEEDGPAPMKSSPMPSSARLFTRAASVRGSSFRGATTDISPKGRTSTKHSSKVAAGTVIVEQESSSPHRQAALELKKQGDRRSGPVLACPPRVSRFSLWCRWGLWRASKPCPTAMGPELSSSLQSLL